MRRIVVIVFLLAAAGCGGPEPPPGDDVEVPPEHQAGNGETQTALVAQDMNLHFYSKQQRSEGEDRPTFSLFSSTCTLDEDGVWSFEGASAVIYGRDGTETHLNAGKGRFDRTNEQAMLAGGVTVQMGMMNVELEDMAWRNEERVARSEHPVSLTKGETQLRGASFQFHPDDDSLVLTDVTGIVVLKEMAEQ